MISANDLYTNAKGKGIALACKYPAFSSGDSVAALGDKTKMFSKAVKAEILGGKISVSTAAAGTQNGVFVCDSPNYATMAELGQTQIVISDQFSGCDLTIIQRPDGGYMGSHVYSDPDCRKCVNEGLPAGWKHIATWKSSGWMPHWKCSGLVAFAFIEASTVTFVFLGVGGAWDAPVVMNVQLETHSFN